MRLNIKTEGFRLRLILPTWLVLNRLILSIALRAAHRVLPLSPTERSQLLRQCRQLRRVCRGVPLVDIRTSAGENILIRL